MRSFARAESGVWRVSYGSLRFRRQASFVPVSERREAEEGGYEKRSRRALHVFPASHEARRRALLDQGDVLGDALLSDRHRSVVGEKQDESGGDRSPTFRSAKGDEFPLADQPFRNGVVVVIHTYSMRFSLFLTRAKSARSKVGENNFLKIQKNCLQIILLSI